LSQDAVRPLLGLKVVEVGSEVSAMFCGRVLGWLGADVTRLEGEGGKGRSRWSVEADGFGEAAYDYCNVDKNVVESTSIVDELAGMLAWADVFLIDWSACKLDAAGLGFEKLREVYPELVVVSMTGHGLTGPRAEWQGAELTAYHGGGEGYLLPGDPVFSQFPDRPPVRGGRFLADYDSALVGVLGTLAAVMRRIRTGDGDVVEISSQEVQLGLNRTHLSRCFFEGRDIDRSDRGYDYGGLLEAADGWITLRPTEDEQWRSFAHAIGRGELAEEPRFATRRARDAHGAELTEELVTWSRARSRNEIREAILAASCPGGPFLEVDEVLEDTVLVERGLFVDTAGGLAPGRLMEGVGESQAVLPPRPRTTGGTGPLAGVRVLDLTWVAAGPYATELLAFLGADVVKVESRERPDLFRRLLQERSDDLDTSIRFVDLNQHKRSVCLDLKTEGGREALLALARVSDVVVDNFRPGVRDRLGIGDDALRLTNPLLVSASMSGFGATGAMRSRPGYASVFNAESGIGAMTGYDDGPPTEIRDSNDLRAGMATACGALAALVARERRGVVGSVSIAAREALVALQGDAILEASRGRTPSRTGNALGRLAPYGLWMAEDDLWVAVAVIETSHWQALVEVVGAPLLRDPALKDPAVRWRERGPVIRVVEEWIRARPARAAVDALGVAGVPVAISAPASVLRSDPHLLARGVFSQVTHPKMGDLTVIGSPVRFWKDGGLRPAGRSPLLGEHTRSVLEGDAGLPLERVDELFESGAVS
jgi:crotonobetainyl-CoA:carnitine CoA-transferase CaiB-like acyl-CoA transferase